MIRVPFRIRFAAKRVINPQYFRKLSKVLAHPTQFYSTLARKIYPGSSLKPIPLKLKDGKVILVREFWSIFLFDEIFMANCYEAPELLKFGPFDAIVDIGANIGMFTLRSKQLWPNARVIAVEPHPDNFEHLQEHLQINRIDDVFSVAKGIADKCGCLDLYLSGRNIGGHSMFKTNNSETISVPVTTLKDVLEMAGVPNGKLLLKVDCEGCEFPLLSNLDLTTADRITGIVFEPEHSLYKVDDLCRKLEGFGFRSSTYGELVVLVKDEARL
jgi:FkbM family methyltransferase